MTVRIDPAAGGVVKLVADKVIPPITPPADTPWVKRFRFQSPTLTKFWGRPIYLGATVLLPRDYDRETMSYPVLYDQGHFSTGAPLRFDPDFKPTERQPYNIAMDWMKPDFPKMVVVTFQHPTPYFDDSYAVNSVNVGPYGDAIMQELIPEVEKRFRVMREPYARVLSGGSTGGWESLALQIFHPDFFGGTWSYVPRLGDVHRRRGHQHLQGHQRLLQDARERLAQGAHDQQPRGQRPGAADLRAAQPLRTGARHEGPLGRAARHLVGRLRAARRRRLLPAALQQAHRRDRSQGGAVLEGHYDLLYYLQRNWTTVGPKIVDKIHVYTGTADTYFLNNSTRELQDWMKTTTNPHYEGFFLYGDGKPHCWSGPVNQGERLKEMAQHIMAHKPDGATTPWWPR